MITVNILTHLRLSDLLLVIGISLFGLDLHAKIIKKKSRQVAQAHGVVIMLDLNQAHEEFKSLQQKYSQYEVIQVPAMQRLSRPELSGLILRRNAAEGARFWACRSINDGICSHAAAQAAKYNQELATAGWSLEEEIRFQLGLIKSDVNAVYVSGHYNLAKDSFGSVIGKWGRIDLKAVSSILENNRIFQTTKFMALLSCYFAKVEFVDSILPIVRKRPMVLVGFKGTAPLSSDPQTDRLLDFFSKIDLNFSRSADFQSNFNKQKGNLIKMLGPAAGARKLSLQWSDGRGNIFDLEALDKDKGDKIETHSQCAEQMSVIKSWLIQLMKSASCVPSDRALNHATSCVSIADLAESYSKNKNELSGFCFNRALQDFQAQKALYSFRQIFETNDLNIYFGFRENTEKTKSRIAKIFLSKNQFSLSSLNEEFLLLEKELVNEFYQRLEKGPEYDQLRSISSDFLAVQSVRESIGYAEPGTDNSSHKDIRVANQLIYLKTRYYLKQIAERIELLKTKLEILQKSDAKIKNFSEFGPDFHSIKFNIQEEIDALKRVEGSTEHVEPRS